MVYYINDLNTHIEIILLKEDNKVFYNKVLFYFLGFDQKADKYIQKFKDILLDLKVYNLKINIVKMKEYFPNKSVGFFYSEDYLNNIDSVLSYYYIVRDKYFLIRKIYWDSDLDLLVINQMFNEYKYLNYNWNNISILGFSMGGRYAIHLIELLNANINSLMLCKTYIMQYKKGESELYKCKSRFYERINIDKNLINSNSMKNKNLKNNKKHIHPRFIKSYYLKYLDIIDSLSNVYDNEENNPIICPPENIKDYDITNNTGYSILFCSIESIKKLFMTVQDYISNYKIIDKTIKSNTALNIGNVCVLDNVDVYLYYSLLDPLLQIINDFNLNMLQSQIYNYKLKFDNNDKHNINSALNTIKEFISNFYK